MPLLRLWPQTKARGHTTKSGPATREDADQHPGYNGASKSAQRIAFSHRFEFRRKRGDLLRGSSAAESDPQRLSSANFFASREASFTGSPGRRSPTAFPGW
jgi:hypothetical protein